jgi:hypothetical protein
MMRWIDLPPLAEVEDRLGRVRRLYGPSLLGRFHFADRLEQVGKIIATLPAESQWVDEYGRSPQLRAAIDGAMEAWGLNSDDFSPLQIQALLLYQENDGGEARSGALVELIKRDDAGADTGQTLAQTIAMLASHCASVSEALDLAQQVPADLLVDVLKSKAELEAEISQDPSQPKTYPSKKQTENAANLRQNFDRLMAAAREARCPT